jgi:hypothetical protein
MMAESPIAEILRRSPAQPSKRLSGAIKNVVDCWEALTPADHLELQMRRIRAMPIKHPDIVWGRSAEDEGCGE